MHSIVPLRFCTSDASCLLQVIQHCSPTCSWFVKTVGIYIIISLGADSYGQRKDGFGADVCIGGRPPHSVFSARSLASSVNQRPFAPTASQRWATVALHYLNCYKKVRGRRKGHGGGGPSTCRTESKTKGKEEGWFEGQEQPDQCGGCGGGIAHPVSDEARLDEVITFDRFLACLPKTFNVTRSGSCPATAVFPLPVSHIGLFEARRSPSRNQAKWKKLCLQRAFHIVVMFLNFLYWGFRFPSLDFLGRCRNSVQRAVFCRLTVFCRLRALLTACDLPGAFLFQCHQDDQALNLLHVL